MLLYSLVSELNRTSNAMVWLAAVGLTDQLVHERVEYELYVKHAQHLQEEVRGGADRRSGRGGATRNGTCRRSGALKHKRGGAKTKGVGGWPNRSGNCSVTCGFANPQAALTRAPPSPFCFAVQVASLNQQGGEDTTEVHDASRRV
jgi:hypothetical protein